MPFLGSRHLATAFSLATAMLIGGCNATSSATSGAAANNQTMPMHDAARFARSGDALLYISDGTGNFYIYTYPGLQYVDEILVYEGASGLCADAAGNVFVTQNFEYRGGHNNFLSGWILEYAHGGRKSVASISDPGARPLGCAIDQTSGTLAVTSYAGENPSASGSLGIFIFSNASSGPQVITNPDLFFYDFCAYDALGDLFVDGQDDHLDPVIAEMPKGSTSLRILALHGLPKSFGYPGAIAWDGKDLAFGDFDHDVIYQLKVSGSDATVVGSTHLLDGGHVEQFTIPLPSHGRARGSLLIAPSTVDKSVLFYHYPAGGEAYESITGLDGALGTAISSGSP